MANCLVPGCRGNNLPFAPHPDAAPRELQLYEEEVAARTGRDFICRPHWAATDRDLRDELATASRHTLGLARGSVERQHAWENRQRIFQRLVDQAIERAVTSG